MTRFLKQKNFFKHKGELNIVRRPNENPQVSREQGIRINHYIDCNEIRLIGSQGENIGIVTPNKGIELATQEDLDLVEISPNAIPPVCKIMDYGKHLYEQKKKQKLADKKQREAIVDTKEIQFRPATGIGDLKVKAKKVQEFIDDGDKVKIVMKLRGREIPNGQMFIDQVNMMMKKLQHTKFDSTPKQNGNKIFAVICKDNDAKNS